MVRIQVLSCVFLLVEFVPQVSQDLLILNLVIPYFCFSNLRYQYFIWAKIHKSFTFNSFPYKEITQTELGPTYQISFVLGPQFIQLIQEIYLSQPVRTKLGTFSVMSSLLPGAGYGTTHFSMLWYREPIEMHQPMQAQLEVLSCITNY